MKKVAIMYPNTASARFLGVRLIESQYVVVAYCPSKEDQEAAENMIAEWQILALEQQAGGDGPKRFFLQTGEDLSDCDLLVVPSVDALRSASDKEYVAMVKRHFRELKDQGLQIKEDAKIIFGSNVGGLIAAGTWVETWPEHSEQVVAVSSIYDVSMKVFGKESSTRAVPVKRKGDVYFNNDIESGSEEKKLLMAMGWTADKDHFSTLEAKLLHLAVVCALENEDFEELEIVGKFPSQEEAIKYKIAKGEIDWLPTVDDLPWYQNFASLHGAPSSTPDTATKDTSSKRA